MRQEVQDMVNNHKNNISYQINCAQKYIDDISKFDLELIASPKNSSQLQNISGLLSTICSCLKDVINEENKAASKDDEQFTASELQAIAEARAETAIPDSQIDWDNIGSDKEREHLNAALAESDVVSHEQLKRDLEL